MDYYYNHKCWYCDKERTFEDDKLHSICDEKQDKMYTMSKLLEERLITFEEYKIMLSEVTGKQFIWNYENHK